VTALALLYNASIEDTLNDMLGHNPSADYMLHRQTIG
jgi:hypothetical protein